MDVRILGPLDVRADGRSLDLGGPRPRALLAVLLLHPGQVVGADRLVDELWGEAPPRSAHHLLHVYVSSLRKALEPAATQPTLLTRSPGYVLELDRDALDAQRFERLLGEGRRLLAGGDAERAAATLREALGLWRGPALADFTYEPFAQAEIARLEELRLVAREERIEADLALGRHLELVGELEAVTAENSFRERPRGQLMLALYRSGRQAEALEAYRATRRILVDELGIEPGPSLKRLEQSILGHDPALELAPPAQPPAPLAPLASRKLVTVLAAELAEGGGLDPEARRTLVARVFESTRAVLSRHGATVERLPDERLMGVFGISTAREDDALRALRAAAELREVPELGIGVETGEAIVEGASVSGDVISGAFRLSRAARPGEILVGSTSLGLVRHAVLTELQPNRDATRLLAVLPETSALPRPRAGPLVGRSRELGELRQAFDEAVRGRAFRLVTFVGAAGVGKSRLAQELGSQLGERAATLVGRCVSYGDGITYWPLREIVRQAVGAETREALIQLLHADADREAVAGGIAAALGWEGESRTREESFWAVRRLVEALARRRPLLLVFEDIHWGEPTFLDLVEYLADAAREAPVLALCLARPELRESRPGWAASTLEPLTRADANALVGELLGDTKLPEEARATIVDSGEGNPLFLEQLLAMLADEERSPDEIALPPSIRAVLAARLDRLGPAERAVLERASVVGREVELDAIAALLPEDAHPSLDRHLRALAERDYLRSEAGTFRFHHALIREAAYRGITKELRAEIHERLGSWLEAGGRAEELVGYHLERAFRFREELRTIDWHARRLAARAADQLAAAGRRALARDDPPSAANLLGRAASLLGDDDPARLAVLPELVEALREVPDLARAATVADDAVAAAAAAGDRRAESLARIERAYVGMMSGRQGSVDEAFAEGEQAGTVFAELGDELGLAKAWRLIAMANRLLGRQSARRQALERALEHVRRTGDRRTEAWIFDGLGGVHNYGPSHVDELLRFARESIEWSRANAQRFNEAHGLAQGLGRSYAMLGDFDAARRAVAEARVIVEDLGFVWHRAGLASAAGFVELLAGDLTAAERELRAGLELAERSGMTGSYFGMALRDELAQVLYAQGRYAEADELCRLSERDAPADDVQAQVQWRALRAKLLACAGRHAEAEQLARAAAGLAEQTEFLIVHANAVADLAEVLRLSGRADEADALAADARRLFEQKGDRVSAERMDALRSAATTRR